MPLLAFSSLFVIVDPIAVVPAFLAMTQRVRGPATGRTARVACLVTVGLLTGSPCSGKPCSAYWAFPSPLQIAGGLILLLVSLDMLRATVHSPGNGGETAAGTSKDDIVASPARHSMLAGPAAISTVILLETQATTWALRAVLLGCLVLIGWRLQYISDRRTEREVAGTPLPRRSSLA